MEYLYETHCHSRQGSLCAFSTAAEMVRAYAAAGYAGLVLTDHFIFGNTTVDRNLSWKERMQGYYDAYLDGKRAGDALDFDVIFGFEHQYGGGKEMLIYGIGLDFLLSNPDIPDIPVDEFVARVHAAGGVAIHAHPYRKRYYIQMDSATRMDLVDGLEVYNACNYPNENQLALTLSQTGDFLLTSGGDIHDCADPRIGRAGIYLPRRVSTEQEFARALKERSCAFQVAGRHVDTLRMEDLTE